MDRAKNLRLFVDCHVFDGNEQGTTAYLRGLYSALIPEKEFDFYFAAFDTHNLKKQFGEHPNVHYLNLRSKNKAIRLLFDIPDLISKHKIDFAHFQYVVPPIKRCRYIVTIHDVLFLDFPQYFPIGYRIKNKMLFRFSARMSEVVLTVSEYSRNRIRAHFRVKHIGLTPNAVDPVYFENYERELAKKSAFEQFGLQDYFLFVSRIEPRKNHLQLIKAFVEGGFHEKHELVFVGNPALENLEYDRYFENLAPEIKKRVKTISGTGQKALQCIVRGARLCIYPSVAEGFGIPPLESVAAKIPTICSNSTAMAEFTFLEPGLFDPLDNKAMIAAIRQGLDAEQNLEFKKEELSRLYSWPHSARAFLSCLDR